MRYQQIGNNSAGCFCCKAFSSSGLNTEPRPCVFLLQQEETPSGLKDPLIQTLTQNVKANNMLKGHGIRNLSVCSYVILSDTRFI